MKRKSFFLVVALVLSVCAYALPGLSTAQSLQHRSAHMLASAENPETLMMLYENAWVIDQTRCAALTLEYAGSEVKLRGFFGNNRFAPTVNIADKNSCTMTLGELLYTDDTKDYILACLRGDEVLTSGTIVLDGTWPLIASQYEEQIAVASRDKSSGKLHWVTLSTLFFTNIPNAVCRYEQDGSDVEVPMSVLRYGESILSCTPMLPNGCGIPFEMEFTDESTLKIDNQPAYWEGAIDGTATTGIYTYVSCNPDRTQYENVLHATLSEDGKTITFDSNWMAVAVVPSYYFGPMTPATITVDESLRPDEPVYPTEYVAVSPEESDCPVSMIYANCILKTASNTWLGITINSGTSYICSIYTDQESLTIPDSYCYPDEYGDELLNIMVLGVSSILTPEYVPNLTTINCGAYLAQNFFSYNNTKVSDIYFSPSVTSINNNVNRTDGKTTYVHLPMGCEYHAGYYGEGFCYMRGDEVKDLPAMTKSAYRVRLDDGTVLGVNESNGTLIVTEIYSQNASITIPAQLPYGTNSNMLPVTQIGYGSSSSYSSALFSQAPGVRSIAIPASVTQLYIRYLYNECQFTEMHMAGSAPSTYWTVPSGMSVYVKHETDYDSYKASWGNATIIPEGWKPETKSYTLTYVVDGEAYKTFTYEYGSAVTPEAEPTKEGYTFSGWSGLVETMPDHDVTVTGSFAVNSYTLTWTADGKTFKEETIAYGAAITEPIDAPEKEGYSFAGWAEHPATMPASNLSIAAQFTINTYKLTYMIDGEIHKEYTYEYGATVTPEAEPAKEGCTFSGWDGLVETMPAHNVTVTGSFIVNTYTLTWTADGETFKEETIAYGAAITEPTEAPAKEGYSFTGWTEHPATMPASDLSIAAQFTINTYTLTYMIDGDIYKEYTYEYGAAINPEPEPTKTGSVFSGWTGLVDTMPAHDVVVNGSFSLKSYTITWVADGSTFKEEKVLFGAPITIPENSPSKEGYTFIGWEEHPATMPSNDLIIFAQFIINSYKLTYVVDGEAYKEYTYIYGATVTPEAEPAKEGYTFSGWDGSVETMPAHDVTVTGSFSVNTYTLTWTADGETFKEETIAYGATITEPTEAPAKEGYSFTGWAEHPATMPASDLSITAQFSITSYTLTYVIDGEVYKECTYEFGATVNPDAEPTKEGHTFSGWDGSVETMPAHDVTVTGSFTVNSYTLTWTADGETFTEETIAYGATITEPTEAPAKEGYSFTGWAEHPATMPASDLSIAAQFTINSYTLTYVVDDDVYKQYTYEFGATVTPEAEPAKEGHTFSGWNGSVDTMPAHDVTVTGSFSVNSYSIMYYVDDELYYEDTAAYGSEITLIAAPEKEGYVFSGWSTAPTTMPACDIRIDGHFTSGIEAVIGDAQCITVYTINGILIGKDLPAESISTLPCGFYIINGKKMMRK